MLSLSNHQPRPVKTRARPSLRPEPPPGAKARPGSPPRPALKPGARPAPQNAPNLAPPSSYPRRPVSTPATDAPQTRQKSAPRRLKSFLEKTLTARETPNSAHASRPHHRSAQPPTAAASSRHPGVFSRDPAPRSVPAHPCHPDLPSIPRPPPPHFYRSTQPSFCP